jgi:hypothetical protein
MLCTIITTKQRLLRGTYILRFKRYPMFATNELELIKNIYCDYSSENQFVTETQTERFDNNCLDSENLNEVMLQLNEFKLLSPSSKSIEKILAYAKQEPLALA